MERKKNAIRNVTGDCKYHVLYLFEEYMRNNICLQELILRLKLIELKLTKVYSGHPKDDLWFRFNKETSGYTIDELQEACAGAELQVPSYTKILLLMENVLENGNVNIYIS